MDTQVVVMALANEHYGVGISSIAEIIMLQPVTYVPRAPAFVEGVTNLRGKVLPVIDLRKRFGLAVAPVSKDTRIVVAEMGGAQVGMIVDAVSEVLKVPEAAIEPPSPLVTTIDSAFLSGIAKVGSRLIILLDLEQVLAPGEKAALPQVPEQHEEMADAALPASAPLAGPMDKRAAPTVLPLTASTTEEKDPAPEKKGATPAALSESAALAVVAEEHAEPAPEPAPPVSQPRGKKRTATVRRGQ